MDEALRAIANPTRRAILRLVWSEERPASAIADAMSLTRPATSQHLRALRTADLVTVRVEANRRLYRVRHDALADLKGFLDDFWTGGLARLKEAAEERSRELDRT